MPCSSRAVAQLSSFVSFANACFASGRTRFEIVFPCWQPYSPTRPAACAKRAHIKGAFRTHALYFSPAAQAVLFHHLLRPDQAAASPSLIATQLRYSAMSIGRAFDYLVDTGLAQAEMHGKERHIRFKTEGRQLFDAAHDLLRSPVRTRKFVRDGHIAEPLKHAESALSDLTDLSSPRTGHFRCRGQGLEGGRADLRVRRNRSGTGFRPHRRNMGL